MNFGRMTFKWNVLAEMSFLIRRLRGDGLLLVEVKSRGLYLEYLGKDVLLDVEASVE